MSLSKFTASPPSRSIRCVINSSTLIGRLMFIYRMHVSSLFIPLHTHIRAYIYFNSLDMESLALGDRQSPIYASIKPRGSYVVGIPYILLYVA